MIATARKIGLSALVLVLAIGTARAEQLSVTGRDVAGLASIDETARRADGGRAVRVSVTFKRFGEGEGGAVARSLSGEGTLSQAGVLEWSYSVTKRQKTSGLASFFRRLGGRGDEVTVERVNVRLVRDAAGRYVGTVDGGAQTWTPRPDTKGLVVLCVPGLSTNAWNKVGIPYLDENMDAIRARGLEVRRLAIKTEASIAANADFIAREVRRELEAGRRPILFAHSKGGSDTTAALALDPELASRVAGVIAIQPVYGGSPLSDWVRESSVLTGALKVTFEGVFKGQKEAVLDLSHASRRAFVSAHPYPADRVPTVVLRSTFDRKLGSKSVLWANQKTIAWKLGRPSDGMVTREDQAIPGAAVTVDLDDLDHFEPGLRGESPHTPADITNRLLDEMLPRVKPAR